MNRLSSTARALAPMMLSASLLLPTALAAQSPTTAPPQQSTRPPVAETMPVWFTSAEGRQVYGVAGITRYEWRIDRNGRGRIDVLGPRPVRSDQPRQSMRAYPLRLDRQQMQRLAWLLHQVRITPDDRNRPCPTDGTTDVLIWRGRTQGTAGIGHCEGHARIPFLNEAIGMLRQSSGAPLPESWTAG